MAIFLDTFSFKEYISSTVRFINWLFSLLDLSLFNVLYWLDLCYSRDNYYVQYRGANWEIVRLSKPSFTDVQ